MAPRRRRWVARASAVTALALGVILVGVVIGRESQPPPELTAASGATYVVTATSRSCWEARRTTLYGERAPRTASGCLR